MVFGPDDKSKKYFVDAYIFMSPEPRGNLKNEIPPDITDKVMAADCSGNIKTVS